MEEVKKKEEVKTTDVSDAEDKMEEVKKEEVKTADVSAVSLLTFWIKTGADEPKFR